MSSDQLPSVEVVIPTHRRPELLRAAIASVLAQDYSGPLSVRVVFDRAEPDHALERSAPVPVVVMANDRAPGLAGARNTGILAADAKLIAFLDDDDTWLPGKLTRQVAALAADPAAFFASTAIEVDFHGTMSVRRAGAARVTHQQLIDSRMSMLHSSTFLITSESLRGTFGLVDEESPASQNEDWDLLLRASAIRPITHVDEPLTRVRWGSAARFADAWATRISGAEWIIGKHPELTGSEVGYARLRAQIAFGHAATGARRTAVREAVRALRTNWREPRAYLALAVASGVVSAERVQRTLHDRGRGI